MKNIVAIIQIGLVAILMNTTSTSQVIARDGNKYFKGNVIYPTSQILPF